jgi:predicted methyltransferase
LARTLGHKCPVTPTWRFIEIIRWNDVDAITHDPLRMRITNLTQPHLNFTGDIFCGHLVEVVRWNDDEVIDHDPLRMRITNQT